MLGFGLVVEASLSQDVQTQSSTDGQKLEDEEGEATHTHTQSLSPNVTLINSDLSHTRTHTCAASAGDGSVWSDGSSARLPAAVTGRQGPARPIRRLRAVYDGAALVR